jgi:hypothetical protein
MQPDANRELLAARAAVAEVRAMVDAWRTASGAAAEEAPPPELGACLSVALEELERAEAWADACEAIASGDYESDPEERAERAAALEAARDEGWPSDTSTPAGGHYGDA